MQELKLIVKGRMHVIKAIIHHKPKSYISNMTMSFPIIVFKTWFNLWSFYAKLKIYLHFLSICNDVNIKEFK